MEHLPEQLRWRCLEVGCAPGHNLVQFHRMFQYQPFGVEYSPVGVQTTRDLFQEVGFAPHNVIEADLLDPAFQRDHAGRYDVVLSRGFIEHFDDPRSALEAHVSLIAPGGFLVCTVPNLRGWSYLYLLLLGRDILRAHNLSIMRRAPYQDLFRHLELRTVHCDYNGTFGLYGMSLRRERSFRGRIARVMDRFSGLCDHGMFALLRGRSIESHWSPTLIYIGKKP